MAQTTTLASNLLSKIQNAKSQLVEVTSGALGSADQFIRKNPVTSTATLAGGALLGGTIVQVAKSRRKKPSKTKAKRKTTTAKKRTTKKKSGKTTKARRWYGKTRGKNIKFTSKGQPYVILRNGRARFIKMSRAKAMKKRKGGYN